MRRLLFLILTFYVSNAISNPAKSIKSNVEAKDTPIVVPNEIKSKIKNATDVEFSKALKDFAADAVGKNIRSEKNLQENKQDFGKSKDTGPKSPPSSATPGDASAPEVQVSDQESPSTNPTSTANPQSVGDGAITGEFSQPNGTTPPGRNGTPVGNGNGSTPRLTQQQAIDQAIAERVQEIQKEVEQNYEQASSNWTKPLSAGEIANLQQLGDSLSTGAHGSVVQEQGLDGRLPIDDRLVEEETPGAITINYYIGSIEQASDEALIALARNALSAEGSSGDATRAELESLVGLLRQQPSTAPVKDSGVRKYEEITSAPERALTDAQDSALASLISKVEKAVGKKRAITLPNETVTVGKGKEFLKKKKEKLTSEPMMAWDSNDKPVVKVVPKAKTSKMSADLVPGLMAALRQRAALLRKNVVEKEKQEPELRPAPVQIASIPTPSLSAARKGLDKVRSLPGEAYLWFLLLAATSLLILGFKKSRKRAVNRELT